MDLTILQDLLIILFAGFFAGLTCRLVGVSMLVGYLLVGTLIGKGILGWVAGEAEEIEYLAHAGVLLLLFSIGLEFSLEDLAKLSRHFCIGGSVQMILVAVPITFLSIALGMAWRPALLVGTAASFSSTVLVFKAMAEWGQTESPHGRRAIAILLFQDVALVPILLLIPLLTNDGQVTDLRAIAVLASKSVLLVAAVLVIRTTLQRWVVPLLARIRSPELVVLFVLALLGAFTLSSFAAGLPPALGAFGAGLVFNGNRLNQQVDALILPFRETFASVFFVSLGMLLDLRVVWDEAGLLLLGLMVILMLKSASAATALRLTGLASRSAIAMGLGLAQMGEFSFVLVMQGWKAGVLTETDYHRMLFLAIGSMILTPLLLKIAFRWTVKEELIQHDTQDRIGLLSEANYSVVIGAGLIGRSVASRLEISGHDVCMMDLSPVNLHPFAQQGFRTVTGDATDPDVLRRARVERSLLVVVCVPEDPVSIRVVKAVRVLDSDTTILVRCRYQGSANELLKAGADTIVSEEAEASSALLRTLERLGQTQTKDQNRHRI